MAPEFGIWTAPGHTIRIEYSAEVIGQIRSAAVDGYLRVRHGGLETGGILFGTHAQDLVRIQAWRPIVCEYARGPSFLLSEADEAALAAALRSWLGDPELAALEPVGWYHSRTRSEIFLSGQDLDYFSRFFPQPWQISLVVRPASIALVRAGFFFREADGGVHAESSYCEFPLAAARMGQPVPKPLPAPIEGERNGAPAEKPHAEPPPAVIEAPRAIEQAVQVALTPAVPPPRRASAGKWYLAALIVLAVLVGIWQWSAPRARLALSATDMGGALHIGWDRTAGPVRKATRGVIEIEDLGVHTEVKLTPADLLAGSISYARQSGDVAVRLRVEPASGPPIEEATRFLQPGVPAMAPAATPAANQPDTGKQQLEREAEAMRARLAQQNAELSKLQEIVHGANPPAAAAAPRASAQPASATPAEAAAPVTQPQPLAEAPAVSLAPPKIEAPPSAIAPSQPPPQKAALPPAPPAPRSNIAEPSASGRLIWTGKLPKTGALVIEGNHASTGVLSGKLPARAARVAAYPGELNAQGMTVFTADTKYTSPHIEAAGEQNGWNRTTYTHDPKRAGGIRIAEQPSPQNGYRAVLQCESAKVAVVVIEWRAQ